MVDSSVGNQPQLAQNSNYVTPRRPELPPNCIQPFCRHNDGLTSVSYPRSLLSLSIMSTDVEAPMEVENVYATSAETKTSDSNVKFSRELMQVYYSRLFPVSLLHRMLGSDSKAFTHREFSFTIKSPAGEEIYLRYQNFADANELHDALLKRLPDKIDIGAVYSTPPKDRTAVQNKKCVPVQRELVFDIDLTDYDQVRHCGCSGAKICSICWGFMQMSVKVMDQGLKEDFGFEHIGWFYSGRRGVHAWVCDESARALTDAERTAVANYFNVSIPSAV